MVWFITDQDKAEMKAAEAARKALDREIEDASKGDIATVTATRDAYLAEQLAANDRYGSLKAAFENDQPRYREEWETWHKRSRELKEIVPALDRQIVRLRQERAEKAAVDWAKDTGTAELYRTYIEDEARRLEPLAALVTGHEETMRANSIPPNTMRLPLPDTRVVELLNFERFIGTLKRAGMKVDTSKVGPAMRARIEAAK